MKSVICELLGLKYPVIQGGMAWIADGRLAAAVSEGGGLGIIAAGNAPADYVVRQIHIARSLTARPFGVNVMMLSPYVREVAEAVSVQDIQVITTGAGNPAAFMKMWNSAGMKVIPVVASASMAKYMTRLGAAAVIAEGCESGGHIGELSTMVLVPQVCDATPLPVIAAGGIADGRGFAASVMLGACAVQMGTRFLAAEECSIHPVYREKVMKAGERCTTVTGRRLGHPVRSLRTAFSRNYEKAEYSGMSDDLVEEMGSGALRLAAQEGDEQKGCFLAGQAAYMVNRVQPAADIIREVVEEADGCLKGTRING